jgi:uncharacterized protein (TIGR03435 family)
MAATDHAENPVPRTNGRIAMPLSSSGCAPFRPKWELRPAPAESHLSLLSVLLAGLRVDTFCSGAELLDWGSAALHARRASLTNVVLDKLIRWRWRLRVGLSTVALWLVCGDCVAVLAQAPDNWAFEVASVRSNKSSDQPSSRFPLGPGDAFVPGNLFSGTNQPLIAYLRFAFKLSQGELLDLPTWVYDEHFDIAARSTGSPTKDQMRLMMQSLLTDRFKLKVHRERRTKPAFNLVLVRLGQIGPQLKADSDDKACAGYSTEQPAGAVPTLGPTEPSSKSGLQLPSIPCGTVGQISASAPDKGRIGGRKVTIERIAGFLKNPFTGVDRQVLDRTGLTGTFDFSLEWSTERDTTGPPDQAAASGPTFLEALQKQLGFKLVATTAPADVLVINHIEHPDEN